MFGRDGQFGFESKLDGKKIMNYVCQGNNPEEVQSHWQLAFRLKQDPVTPLMIVIE